jgi:glycosyltransferase involved in cell wall biosynthesis
MLDSKILDRLVKARKGPKSRTSGAVDFGALGKATPETSNGSHPKTKHSTSRADVFAIIARSGLFEADHYRQASPGIEGNDQGLLEHFLDVGCDLNLRPNAYFEPAWYVQAYPDVSAAGMQPFLHYILHGDIENRKPGPLFNTSWYRREHNLSQNEIALAHYLSERRNGTVSPLPEFDITYYAKNNPDVIAAQIDPFEHFISYGFREGRNPSADFDVRWYAEEYLSGSLATNPFYHWLSHKGQPGIYGRFPDDRTTIAREVRQFTRPAPEFEELRPLPQTAVRKAKILAYYLPQFHSFMENDAWWGAGFTEWANLPRGLPRFKGHYQPRVPRDLGFYKLDKDGVGETLRRQATMAQKAGIHGFVFYHYWFNGKRLMSGPVDHLLSDLSVDLPFCLMWANENWTRRWDGAESEVLISQDYREDDDETMIADFARHFSDPRYIRLGGRPLLMVYRPGIVPKARESIERWRALFRSRFSENPIVVMAQAFGDNNPQPFGLDGAIEFPPHKLTQHMPPINHQLTILDPEFAGKAYRYEDVVTQSLEEPDPNFPLIKTLVPSWDNDSRRQGAGLVITGSTPALYEEWLTRLVERAVRVPFFNEPIVCINAWNEWCEGAYLEPDLHFGAAYLNATGRAVAGLSRNTGTTPGRLLLIGHDAFPGGAQTLLLRIGDLLLRNHGVQYEFLLLDGGRLVPDYKAQAPTTVLQGGVGLDAAVVNTTAAGYAVTAMSNIGHKPVLLVHELPRILREKNLLDAARRGLRDARLAVFAARFVRDALYDELGLTSLDTADTHVMPQGSYTKIEPDACKGKAFRLELGIPKADPMVIGIGYADLRKGFDIFLQLWRLLNQNDRIHFCWLGNIDPGLNRWLADEIRAARETGTFHMPGQVPDIVPALSSCNAFALTSREDPFPTVALEALAAGLPVVAFKGSGGIPELLEETEAGVAVPYGDVTAMAGSLVKMLRHPSPSEADKRRAIVKDRFSFPAYVSRLLRLSMPGLHQVSVAIPNYNYAQYMPERLGSIFRQSHPVHEVLVLDDCSSDKSLAVIPAIAADWKRDIQLILNPTNSGSVFAQWRRAAQRASGDWLWIAEADDSSNAEFLSDIFATVQQEPGIVFAFSDSCTILEDGSAQWDSYKAYYATIEPNALCKTEIFDASEFVSRFLSIKNVILNVSAVVWRREAFLNAMDAVGEDLTSYRMAGDWRLYLQALSIPGARMAYVSTPLNVHRRHSGSVTHQLSAEKHIAEIRSCQAFARSAFPSLNKSRIAAQNKYIEEVTEQLTGTAAAAPGKSSRGNSKQLSEFGTMYARRRKSRTMRNRS